MIEPIWIRKTGKTCERCSSHIRFGSDPQITIPASGLAKCRNERPDRRPHSTTRSDGQKLLALWAATTEGFLSMVHLGGIASLLRLRIHGLSPPLYRLVIEPVQPTEELHRPPGLQIKCYPECSLTTCTDSTGRILENRNAPSSATSICAACAGNAFCRTPYKVGNTASNVRSADRTNRHRSRHSAPPHHASPPFSPA